MIQRYGLFGAYDDWKMEPDSDGEYVLFSDHVAEVERLREALRKIADGRPFFAYVKAGPNGIDFDAPGSPFDRGKAEGYEELQVIARAALQDRPTPTDGGKG